MTELRWLEPHNLEFPPAEQALPNPNGLLAVGGDLSVERLLIAYRQGIFPWYEEGQPLLWWSPDPRTVLAPGSIHASRSMRRFLRRSELRVSFDQAFAEVIAACAAPREYTDATWITPDMQQAYINLHQLGHAHSVEVWEGDQLVGGLYGVALGRMFFGESMFSRRSNASKTALLALGAVLRRLGCELIDCQMPTEHLSSMGAREVPRVEFIRCIRRLTSQPDIWPAGGIEPRMAASILEAFAPGDVT